MAGLVLWFTRVLGLTMSCGLMLTGCLGVTPVRPPQALSSSTQTEPGVLPYRQLTVEDFQARSAPADVVDNVHRLNAHTRLSLRTIRGGGYLLEEIRREGRKRYRARFHSLRFEPVMLPEESWWNPAVPWDRRGYVLQHEQIHFAIMKAEAERLNRVLAERPETFEAIEETAEGAKRALIRRLDQLLERSRRTVKQRHERFDRDTSGRYDPVLQNWWYQVITAEF